MSEYFLPVIVTDHPEGILQGNIEISDSKRLSMQKLFCKNGVFLSMDPEAMDQGRNSVIIFRPTEFARRLNEAVCHARPYLCTLQYNPSERNVSFIVVKHPMLSGNFDFPSPLQVKMDDISVVTSTEGLVRGEMPENLTITDQFDCVRDFPQGIVAGVESVVGDFTFVKPEQEWMDLFYEYVFHSKTWKPAIVMDQVVAGGAYSPTLSFWHTNALDHVEIRRNVLKVCMQSKDEGMRQLFSMILRFLDSQKKQKYTHLSAEYVVDLGMVETEYQRLEHIGQNFSFQGKSRFCMAKIDKGLSRGINVFGMDTYRKDWLVYLQLATCKNIHIGTWGFDDVQKFMSQTDKEVKAMVGQLATEKHEKEDAYGTFDWFRRKTVQQYI